MKLSMKELSTIVSSYIDSTKVAGTWVASYSSITGLLDKIGKQVMLDSEFVDDLAELDGDDLPFGKTIEEWFEDLILPIDYDSTGADTMAPHDPTYRPNSYSYDLGTKTIASTLRKNEFEASVLTAEGQAKLVMMITKRLYDSLNAYRYQSKLQLLNTVCEKASSVMAEATVFAISTAYPVNKYLKESAASDKRGIVVKAIGATTATWAANVADGHIIVESLKDVITKPTTQETAQAFIAQLKKDIELAQFASEGNSLNGNTLCAKGHLKLYIIPGIQPVLDTYLYSNAFNAEYLKSNVEIKVIKELPGNTNG